MMDVLSRRVKLVSLTREHRRIFLRVVGTVSCLVAMCVTTRRVNLLSSNLMGSPLVPDISIFEESKLKDDNGRSHGKERLVKLRFDWTNMTLLSPMAK